MVTITLAVFAASAAIMAILAVPISSPHCQMCGEKAIEMYGADNGHHCERCDVEVSR